MNWLTRLWCSLDLNKEQIKILLAFATLFIAFYGLNNWRRQINGTNQVKIARKLLGQVYLIRDLFKNARFKVFWEYENPKNDKLSKEEILIIQLNNRIAPLKDALIKFENDYYEAFVEWGIKRSDNMTDLKKLYFKYIDSINTFIKYHDLGVQNKHDAYKIIFQSDSNDEFGDRLESIVKSFDTWLRPKFQGAVKRLYYKIKNAT